MRMRPLLGCTIFTALIVAGFAPAQNPTPPPRGVKKITASFEPAEAKPGQTVTYRLTVQLEDGYYTYPLKQPDKQAAGMVNKITFPDAGAVVFVGEPRDSRHYKSKSEPELGINEMRYMPKEAVYERTVVVSPKATAGVVTVKLPVFSLSVCDKDNCFPPKKLSPEATLKVLPGPAVEVEKAYRDAVK